MFPSLSPSPLIYVELSLSFSDCSIKFDTMQFASSPSVFSLSFHRILSLLSYDSSSLLDLPNRLVGALFMPDPSRLTDQQRTVCDCFVMSLTSSPLLVAEAIDERAENVYLVVSEAASPDLCSFLSSNAFALFVFRFEELWALPAGVLGLVKTLHLSNVLQNRRVMDLKNSVLVYKQCMANWNVAQASKEYFCEKLYNEGKRREKREEEKPKNLEPQICVVCYSQQKNVVFLPCGHIAVCKECAVESMGLELCKIFYKKNKAKKCIVCKGTIKEAREVFI
jgi:hypothetical protein